MTNHGSRTGSDAMSIDGAGFLAALDAAPLPMWLSDADYGGTYFNAAWLELRGRSLEQEIRGGWMSGIHPDDLDNVEGYAAALDHGNPFTAEYRLLRHDGSWRWMLDTGRPRIAPCGTLIGYIGTCIDITERKRIETELRRSEQRFQLAQDGASVGSWDWDLTDGATSWSPQMYALYGLDPVSAGPDHFAAWSTRLHPEDRDRAEQEARAIPDGPTRFGFSFRILHPETGLRWIESRGQVSHDRSGRPARVVGVNIDVTDQRRRDGERDRAALMLRMSMDVTGIGTWEFDPATRQVVGSSVTNTLFGLPEDGRMRPVAEYQDRVHPDDIDFVRADIAASVSRGGGETERTYRVIGADDTVRWVTSKGAHVRLADGSDRLIGAMFDITERKRIEDEREAALQHQQTLLQELNHRVKNNLQLILSMLRLQASRAGIAGPVFASTLKRVEAIGDLHGQLSFASGTGLVDFGGYIHGLAEKTRSSILADTPIRLECRVTRCDIDIDRAVPLGMVVNELVTNAIKYAFDPETGGTITLTLERREDGLLRVGVADDGRGLPEPGDPAHRGGLGTGLVQALTRQIGARLERLDGPGVGYLIELPLDD